MILRDLSARKRREVVGLMLGVTLQDLAQPASTREVADAIARRLETDETGLIGRTLMKLAAITPEAERSEAVTFKRYGQSMKPWVWSPRRVLDQAKTESEPRRNVDNPDEMWTVYPSDLGQ